MIPWLVVSELLSKAGRDINELVSIQKSLFPSSGEINFQVGDVRAVLQSVEKIYETDCLDIDRQDGLSFLFSDWRFNLRGSNTEPLLRLNVETHGDRDLLSKKVEEISSLVKRHA